jgi:hypothetical protein
VESIFRGDWIQKKLVINKTMAIKSEINEKRISFWKKVGEFI